MAPRKSERLVNLTICLLAARRYVSRDDLRRMIEGYRDLNDSNFERTFERDKDELRALGIPIEVGSNNAFHEDEVGYRISRADFELPPLDLSPGEATAVALAARMWQEAAMAEHTRSALVKLRALGAEPDTTRLAALSPVAGGGLATAGEGFDAIWQAIRDRRRIRFSYRAGERERTLEPWTLSFRRGAWYVVGLDVDRGEERMFRTSRIQGEVTVVGEAGAFTPPDEDATRAVARRLAPASEHRVAILALAPGAGHQLRRGARPTTGEGAPEGFEVVEVDFTSTRNLAADVASLGQDAHVIAPDDLRDAVVALLEGLAGE